MKVPFLPSPTTKMISFHGKQSYSFMVIYIIVIFSFNIFICNSLQPDQCKDLQSEWWPIPNTNLTLQYTSGSTFVRNLNATLNRLLVKVEHTSQGRFNISVYGQTPNQIYAFLQCRGDATVYECYNCSRQAKIDALQYCGNYVGCSVWSKFCFLRYNGNYNFTGHLDDTGYNNFNNVSASPDPAAYAGAARQLLSNLSSIITAGTATNRYASGSTADSSQLRPIYGMAQCWGDIPLADCKACLSTRIDELFKNNNGLLGARGMARSCIIRYEGCIFFNPSLAPAPQIDVAFPSPPEKSSSKLPIILGVTGGFLLLFILFMFGIRNKLKSALCGSRQGGYYEGNDSRFRKNQQQSSEGYVLARIPSLSRAFSV